MGLAVHGTATASSYYWCVTVGNIDANKLARELGIDLSGPSNPVLTVTTIDEPIDFGLAFYTGSDPSVVGKWQGTKGSILCDASLSVPESCSHLETSTPRRDFGRILRSQFVEARDPYVAETARIHPSVEVGEETTIGEYVVIEEGSSIGDRSTIGHHTTIHRGTRIGSDVVVGANTVVGSTGFGLERDEDGQWSRIPHLGHVVIEDDVEIGASCVIARGTIKTTRIGKGSKIDDQVFIAHNVQIAEDCVVIANAEVSGSVNIGRGSWIGPHSTVIEQVSIGENSLIGIGSVVIRDVPPNVIAAGNPARVLRDRTD